MFGLGAIGALLPILPTTPFLLLSGYFFVRSSEKMDRWLKGTKLYNFYVADYVEYRAIPREKKQKIWINILILMGISIYFAPLVPVKILLSLLTIFLTYMLYVHIPDKEEEDI